MKRIKTGPPDDLARRPRQERRRGPVQGPGPADGLVPEGPRRQRRPGAGARRRAVRTPPTRSRAAPSARTRTRSPPSASPSLRACRTAGRSPRRSTSPGSAARPSTPTTTPSTIAATSDQLQSDLKPFKAAVDGGRRHGDGLDGELSDARGEEAGRALADDRQDAAPRAARLRRRGDHRRPRGRSGLGHASRPTWRASARCAPATTSSSTRRARVPRRRPSASSSRR